MKTEYAQAFVAALKQGTSIDDALLGLDRVLQRMGHTKLRASILQEVVRTLEAEGDSYGAVVTVAKKEDTAKRSETVDAALTSLGVTKSTPVTVVVDETLIGGFVATYNNQEYDASYKKLLKSLYESIIT